MYENLPIYKAAMELAVYMEQIVQRFQKYHKYTMGIELRQQSKVLLFAISRANMAKEKVPALIELRNKCEEMKILIQLCHELKVFNSFKQFERSAFLSVSVSKQAQAWLEHNKRVGGG